MRPYTTPDTKRPIEEIRAEVKRDYETLAEMLQLPAELGFEAAAAATRVGMMPRDAYPFKEFQQAFAETVAKHSASDGAFTDAFEIVTGVWNYFPHDDLGMSPIERMQADMAEGKEVIDYEALREEEQSPERQERMANAVDMRLEFLAEVAESNLRKHLRRIGGTKKDAENIVAILKDPEEDPDMALLYLIGKMTESTKQEKSGITMEDIQPVARAMAMCENHITSVIENNHKSSRMMSAISDQCAMHIMKAFAESKGKAVGSIEIIEPVMLLESLLDVHGSINGTAKHLHIPEGIEEAAHHILDWLMLTDMHEIIAHNDSEEYAALILAAARLIAATGDSEYSFDEVAQTLRAEVSNITDDTTYNEEVARIARKALCSCNDPSLMMPTPGQEPDDFEDRLAVIAPDLKLRSSISPDDLSVPSPFGPLM